MPERGIRSVVVSTEWVHVARVVPGRLHLASPLHAANFTVPDTTHGGAAPQQGLERPSAPMAHKEGQQGYVEDGLLGLHL